MEKRRKSKLLATASCQGQAVRAVTEGLVDRLSNLPDHVAHHILSFLVIKDLTRLGCVSKRCGELCLSAPSLNFEGFSGKNMKTYDKRLRLWSYLDRYLFHRGVRRIERFQLHWELHYADQQKILRREDERFRLDKWLCNAIRCNVQVLAIDIKTWRREALRLPLCVFLCGSLKSLVVDKYCEIPKVPSLASLSNLECLKLRDVIIPDEGFFKWISSSCKCIKELYIGYEFHNQGSELKDITIESSSLESLDFKWFDNCHLNISGEKLRKIIINCYASSVDKSLKICAPNLKSFKWTGGLMNYPNMGSLECLEEAEISLFYNLDDYVKVSEVLCSLCSAKVLVLNRETTMALFKGGSLPGLLKNVCYLCIDIEGFLDILVPAMTSLLGGMSKLSTLIIKSDSFFRGPKADPLQCSGFNMGYWKLQNAAFIYQLKEVTIELSPWSNGIEFARYILEHAQNLNKITIVHSPQQSNAMRKLNTSKMTSNITLDFQEDQRRGPQKRRGRRVV